MSDEQILKQWDKTIEDYENNFAPIKQHLEAVINDPNATDEEKAQASLDLHKQESYLNQLKANRDRLQSLVDAGQPLPSTVNFDVSGGALLCKKFNDPTNTIYPVYQDPYQLGKDTVVLFSTDFAQLAIKVEGTNGEFEIQSTVSSDIPKSGYTYHEKGVKLKGKYSGQYADFISYEYQDQNTPRYFATITGQSASFGGDGTARYTQGQTVLEENFDLGQVPVLTVIDYLPYIGYTNNLAELNASIGYGIEYDCGNEDVPTETPWDYYNDNIKDDISNPDNAVFPDGYDGPDPGQSERIDGDEDGIPDEDDIKDEGEIPDYYGYYGSPSLTSFTVLTPETLKNAKNSLATQIQDSLQRPSDPTTFLMLLGKWDNNGIYEAAADYSLKDFIISARLYPFDLNRTQSNLPNRKIIDDTAEAQLYLGYKGATLAAGNRRLLNSITRLYMKYINIPGIDINNKPTYNIEEISYLSFEPYTKYTIVLPFIGECQLPSHAVAGATIGVRYVIDFSTGECTAAIYAGGFEDERDGFNLSHARLILQKTGTCSINVSIAGNDLARQGDQMAAAFGNLINVRLGNIAGKTRLAGQALGGIGDIGKELAKKDFSNATAKTVNSLPSAVGGIVEFQQMNLREELAAAEMVQASKEVPYVISGGTGASATILLTNPYVIVTTGSYYRPKDYGHIYGLPWQEETKLSGIKGYFECANPDISSIGSQVKPLNEEQKMLNDALRNGSYFK